jgi:hypothetical protein
MSAVKEVIEDYNVESALDCITSAAQAIGRAMILGEGVLRRTTLAKAQALLDEINAQDEAIRVEFGWTR